MLKLVVGARRAYSIYATMDGCIFISFTCFKIIVFNLVNADKFYARTLKKSLIFSSLETIIRGKVFSF